MTGCSGLPQVSNKAYADIVKGGAPVTVKPKERQKCMVTKEDLEKKNGSNRPENSGNQK